MRRVALVVFGVALVAAMLGSCGTARAALFTNTADVEGLALDAGTVWVATRGGLEAYDASTLVRRRVYTTEDGLTTNAVVAVEARAGQVVARTVAAECLKAGERFTCASRPSGPPVATSDVPDRLFQGARVTATLTVGRQRLVGTAGQGLWVVAGGRARPARRLTPVGQICGNHVVAVARFAGRTWLGTFDQGLCSFDGGRFQPALGRFRMVNDLVATPEALYVAAATGLFRTRDGQRFERVVDLDGHGAIDLAFDGQAVWVVSSVALWRISVAPGARPRRVAFRPAGVQALQAVDVRAGAVWLASEDAGVLRLRGSALEIFDRASGLPASWTIDVAATADGGAYVATLRDGLVRIDPSGRASRVLRGVPDRWLLHVSAARDPGAFWIGSQDGAARLETAATTNPTRSLPALPDPCVHVLFEAEDGLWIGTEGGTVLEPRSS